MELLLAGLGNLSGLPVPRGPKCKKAKETFKTPPCLMSDVYLMSDVIAQLQFHVMSDV
jgi:hypothetical protein